VRTLASSGGTIDTGTTSWSVPNAATITTTSWSITGDTTVSALSTQTVLFSLSFPVELNSIIEFTFPSDITITSSELSAYAGGGIFQSVGTTFITKTATVVKINGSTASTSSNTNSFITFSSIRNPNKVKTTDSMTIKVYTSANNLIASVSTGVTIASTALQTGSTNISSITGSSLVVQSTSVSYTFTFNPGK